MRWCMAAAAAHTVRTMKRPLVKRRSPVVDTRGRAQIRRKKVSCCPMRFSAPAASPRRCAMRCPVFAVVPFSMGRHIIFFHLHCPNTCATAGLGPVDGTACSFPRRQDCRDSSCSSARHEDPCGQSIHSDAAEAGPSETKGLLETKDENKGKGHHKVQEADPPP